MQKAKQVQQLKSCTWFWHRSTTSNRVSSERPFAIQIAPLSSSSFSRRFNTCRLGFLTSMPATACKQGTHVSHELYSLRSFVSQSSCQAASELQRQLLSSLYTVGILIVWIVASSLPQTSVDCIWIVASSLPHTSVNCIWIVASSLPHTSVDCIWTVASSLPHTSSDGIV